MLVMEMHVGLDLSSSSLLLLDIWLQLKLPQFFSFLSLLVVMLGCKRLWEDTCSTAD
jgi:hypothetical protein